MAQLLKPNTVTVDVTDIVDGLCWLLARWAVKSDRVPPPKRHEVGYRIGTDANAGLVKFLLVTNDDIGIEFEADMVEVMKAPRTALDGIMRMVRDEVAAARKRRREQTRIEIQTATQAEGAH